MTDIPRRFRRILAITSNVFTVVGFITYVITLNPIAIVMGFAIHSVIMTIVYWDAEVRLER